MPLKKGKKGKKKEEPNMNNIMELDVEVDFEKLVRTEYLKLQRQYRLMEDERHHLAGAGNALSKQARLVELLRVEAEDLETDLYNADSKKWEEFDKESVRTILTIMEYLGKAQADSLFCLKNIHEMCSQVDRITKQLVEHQLRVQTIYGRSMTVPQADRRKRILENRLYLYTTRFDTKLSSNKSLREEINMMLKLRGLFYQRHLSMKRQLANIRVRMSEVVFTATQAYEHRDEFVSSIRNIRDKNDKDTRQHVLEIKEFHRVLHHDAKAREFNMLKNKERQMLESARQRDARRNMARRDEMDATLNAYNLSFKLILDKFQFGSLESLIKHYKEMEQQNFARFVAISDINHEVNVLKDETGEMSKEIEEYFAESQKLGELREQDLESLSLIVEGKTDDYENVKQLIQMAEYHLRQILEALHLLFKTSGSTENVILRLLGNEKPLTVTPYNVIHFMHAIETRARELMVEKQNLELRKSVEIDNMSVLRAAAGKQGSQNKGKHAGGPFLPDVIVAGRVDGDDEEDEEDRGSNILCEVEYRNRVKEKMLLKREFDARASEIMSFIAPAGGSIIELEDKSHVAALVSASLTQIPPQPTETD